MPGTYTLITAAYPPKIQFFHKTVESVLSQRMPEGWRLEWLIIVDSASRTNRKEFVSKYALNKPGVRIMLSDRRLGQAVCRNLALTQATGSLVRNLDHDDVITPGAISRDIRCMEAHPEVAFCASATMNMMMPDEVLDGWLDPPEGPLPAGWLPDMWIKQDGIIPVHPSTMCIRIEPLRTIGGWAALLPFAEDAALACAINTVWPGWFIAKHSLHYRIWSGQTSDGLGDDDPIYAASQRAITQRIHALRGNANAMVRPDLQKLFDDIRNRRPV